MDLADRVDTSRDVAPLVGAADLQLDIVVSEEVFKIDGLENLVGKFRKGNTGFQAAGDDFFAEHDVDAEQFAVIAEEVEKTDLAEPVVVIDKVMFSESPKRCMNWAFNFSALA